MPTSTKTARTMISGASKLAKRTSKATVWLFCRQTTTTSAMRTPMIQARQLVGFFSCGPTGQILDALPDLAVGLISVQPPFQARSAPEWPDLIDKPLCSISLDHRDGL